MTPEREETIDQQLRMRWPLICELACRAMILGCSFQDLVKAQLMKYAAAAGGRNDDARLWKMCRLQAGRRVVATCLLRAAVLLIWKKGAARNFSV